MSDREAILIWACPMVDPAGPAAGWQAADSPSCRGPKDGAAEQGKPPGAFGKRPDTCRPGTFIVAKQSGFGSRIRISDI